MYGKDARPRNDSADKLTPRKAIGAAGHDRADHWSRELMVLADVLMPVGIAAYRVVAGGESGPRRRYLAGTRPRGRPVRDFTNQALAPTSFASSLSMAAVGITVRGTASATRSGALSDDEPEAALAFIFGASSMHALGAISDGLLLAPIEPDGAS